MLSWQFLGGVDFSKLINKYIMWDKIDGDREWGVENGTHPASCLGKCLQSSPACTQSPAKRVLISHKVFLKVILHRSTPPRFRRLIRHYYWYKESVDGVVAELTFAKRLFVWDECGQGVWGWGRRGRVIWCTKRLVNTRNHHASNCSSPIMSLKCGLFAGVEAFVSPWS